MVAGLDVIHRFGFNGSSVQDITQAADVPKGSFYNHFASKEVFGAAILDLYWQKMATSSLPILSDEILSPIERLDQYFNQLGQELAALNYEQGCLLGNLGAELTDQSRLVRDRLSALLAGWTRSLEGCIREAQAAGQIRGDLEASVLAAFLVNAWEGTVLRAKIDRDESAIQQFKRVISLTLFC